MEMVGTPLLEQMRKWGLNYDGRDPYAFLERINELQQAYQLSDEKIFRGFPEHLKGDALLWYRNDVRSVTNLKDLLQSFRQYYLSPHELRNLEFSISSKKLEFNEDFRKFVGVLWTLMRRHGGYEAEKEIDIIYWNMLPKYRLYIPRNEVSLVNLLLQRVEGIAKITRDGNL